MESFLSDFHTWMVFISLGEIAGFITQTMFFAGRRYNSGLGYCIVGLVHPARAFVALLLLRYLPTTQELIPKICRDDNTTFDYAKVMVSFPRLVKIEVEKTYTIMQPYLKLYAVLSAAALLIDLASSLAFLIYCERSTGYLSMLLILTLYFYADTWLVFYGLLHRQRLDFGQSAFKAMLGLGDEFKSDLLGGSHL